MSYSLRRRITRLREFVLALSYRHSKWKSIWNYSFLECGFSHVLSKCPEGLDTSCSVFISERINIANGVRTHFKLNHRYVSPFYRGVVIQSLCRSLSVDTNASPKQQTDSPLPQSGVKPLRELDMKDADERKTY